MKRLWLIGAFFASLPAFNASSAQCTLACNDQVNVSIPSGGFAVVEPDMILDGDDTSCPGPKTVEIYEPSGMNLGDTVTCTFVGELLMVSVIDVNSGNSCWGSIFVEDKLPPVITCQNWTVSCTADLTPASLGLPLISDNCDSDPALTYVEIATMQPCSSPNASIISRTWHAVDESGNIAIPCLQTITVIRPALADVTFPPNFDNNQEPVLICGSANTDPSNTGYPLIDGNPVTGLCKINVEYLDQTVTQCGGAFTILRKWKVIDCCTNEILNHTQIIQVADNEPPSLVCPDTIEVGANGPGCAGTFFLPPIGAADNCSNPLTFRTIIPGTVINGNGGMVFALPAGEYVVTYEVRDACQNTATCDVVLLVKDNVVPVAVCDETTVVALNANGTATVPAQVFDDGSYDACCAVTFEVRRMDDSLSAFGPSVQFTCDDAGDTVMVVLKVEDCHGNANSCMVLVMVQDKTPPMLSCPPGITIPCDSPMPPALSLTGEPTVNEACGLDTLFFTDVENLNMCNVGTIVRTFTAVDEAGFQSSCSQTITLVDLTPPQFFFPADTAVDCSVPLDSISAGEAIALGDCEIFGLNISDEIFPKVCGLKIFRTYKFQEWCSGYDTAYTQTILVDDVNPPVWDAPPGSLDRIFLCEGDFVKPDPPSATDYCTPVTVELVTDTSIFGDCPNRFTRILTYTAADTCGNVADNFVITLQVKDTIAPTADTLPALGPFNCYGDRPAPDILDVTGESDNCISPVTVEFVADTGDPGCSGVVVRSYRLVDTCGNDTLILQNILINDTLAPTADPAPLGPFACFDEIPVPEPDSIIAADNCGGPVLVEFVADSGDPGCAGIVERTFRLTDQCGNDTLIIQPILINDTVPPALTCPANMLDTIFNFTCEKFVNDLIATAVDNCPARPVTISNDYTANGANANGVYPLGVTMVTFTAMDDCNNVATCQTMVEVVEVVPPALLCSPFLDTLNADGLLVINLDSLIKAGYITAADSCSEVTLTITPDTLTCDDFTTSPVTSIGYTVTATDASGNTATCSNTLLLSDPFNACMLGDDTLVVGGLIFDENHQPMPGVEVQMSDPAGMTFTYTSSDGLFVFESVPFGSSCQLQPVKNDGLLNGITAFDLVLLSRHILGMELLNSPYKIIAADVNNSGSVSTLDVVCLRRAILQIADDFPNNTSWRFIDAGYEFPDPANPFAAYFPENAWLPAISQDIFGHSFVAVKVGDLNGSAAVNFDGATGERGGEAAFKLSTASRNLTAGEVALLPVESGPAARLTALQLTLQFDPKKISIEKITGAALKNFDEKNYAQPLEGYLTLSWDTPAGQFLEGQSTLFFIEIKSLENTTLEEALMINSTITPAIAYENGGNPLNIGWRIHEARQTPVDAARLFALEQNRPNPFRQETFVRFFLEQRMPVRLEVADLAGRKFTLLDQEMDAGWHEQKIDGNVLSEAGIYFYQIITPFGMERKKMIQVR